MLVIGLAGKIGSGKDEVAKFLEEERGFFRAEISEIAKEITRNYGREVTRENIQLSTKEYRAEHGKDALGKMVLERIRNSGEERAVVNAVRLPEDILPTKAAFGHAVHVIEITAPASVRFSRLRERGSVRDPMKQAEFAKQEADEEALFPAKALVPLVEHQFENAGTRAKLFRQIDHWLAKLK